MSHTAASRACFTGMFSVYLALDSLPVPKQEPFFLAILFPFLLWSPAS